MSKELILDGSKIAFHTDRVEAWEAGERIAPVSIDMALTRACQASCRGCYAVLQEPQERMNITVDHAYAFLDDCAEIGVRAISLISDGESSLSKAYVPFIKRAAELGIDVGNATNGWIWNEEMMQEILPLLKWVRFTVLAGNADSFTRMMTTGTDHKAWAKMQWNIEMAAKRKYREHLDVTLGIQTFIMPSERDEIMDFAQLGVDLGVDYAVIKHMSDDEYGSFGVKYEDYGALFDALREAEALSNDVTQVVVKWNKLKHGNKPPYTRMYATPFLLQISGSGLVAPSGMFFNARYSKLHIGNFTEERFIDIWRSDRYWDAMNYLASEEFDARTMMGALSIQHYANVDLNNHVSGIKRIVAPPPGTPEPLHVNFV